MKHKFTIWLPDIDRVCALPRLPRPVFGRLSGDGIKKRFLRLFRHGDESDIYSYMMRRIECGSDHPPTTPDWRLFGHGPDVGGIVKSVLDYIVFQLHCSSPGSLSTCNEALVRDRKFTRIIRGAQSPEIGTLRGHPGDAHSPVKLPAEGICQCNDWQHSARLQGLSGRVPAPARRLLVLCATIFGRCR